MCGCDNVTYWNASVAASFGVSIKTSGAKCAQPVTCTDVAPCPANRYCNYDVGSNNQFCSATGVSGVCWGLPTTCPAIANNAKTCATTTCTTECQAIHAELAFFDKSPCN